tara:strand:+ start:76 stop:279 length:204 start_codon:yes stop_codon:yes gene_type:complete
MEKNKVLTLTFKSNDCKENYKKIIKKQIDIKKMNISYTKNLNLQSRKKNKTVTLNFKNDTLKYYEDL